VADVGILLSINDLSITSAADVVFTSKSLKSLPLLFSVAKKVVKQARLNVRWAITYNIFAISLAIGILEPLGLRVTA